VQLGMGYLKEGDMQSAKQKLALALQQAPDSAQAQDAMGYFMESTGDNSAAEKYYLKAINLNPKAGAAQNNYGVFLCRTGRYQQSISHFLLAVQDVNYLKTAEAYENAGTCAMQIPDIAQASDYFQKATLQDPKRPLPYLALGQIEYKQGNYQQAQQNLNQYMQLVKEPGADALLLGIELARLNNDNITAGRYTLMLQARFPNSQEYKQIKAVQKNNLLLTAPTT
jgi:type IV pilus assembly protein PilF